MTEDVPASNPQANPCPIECPNRRGNCAKYVDKGFSYLSAFSLTLFLAFVALIYERQGEKVPPFVVVPCVGLVGIALLVPTEKSAELVGKLLSFGAFKND